MFIILKTDYFQLWFLYRSKEDSIFHMNNQIVEDAIPERGLENPQISFNTIVIHYIFVSRTNLNLLDFKGYTVVKRALPSLNVGSLVGSH